ncbi:galactose oxidase [Aureococcus anophagefferens]|nr:galactose oxidase [Aureococcus anophagefferens]
MLKLVALAAGAAAACVDDASWTFDLNGVDGQALTCSKLARKLNKGVPAAKARRLAAIGRGAARCYDADREEIPAAVCACHASCNGCGYTADRMPTRASDCVACPEGSFLFPQRDDMTGLCVGDYAPTPLPSYAPSARRGYLDGAPGTCAETWTVPSLPGCEAPQFGCPATACDGEDRRWCCPPGAADCATEWRHCGDDAPTAAPTYGPSAKPTHRPWYKPTDRPA